MADTFSNDLRLRLQESGSNAGTWGDLLNGTITNIASGFGQGSEAIPNASTHTITLADGTADEARSLYLKCTGGGQACTVTLGPNTISKVWIIDNATSYTLTFSQGSGANVAIAAGAVKVIATDGAGSGAAVVDTLDGLEGSLSTLAVTGTATMGGLTLDGNNSYTSNIKFDYGASAPTYFANWGYKSSSDGNKVFLTMTDGGAAKDVLVANYNGNVGIGVSAPSALLNIAHESHGIALGYEGATLPVTAGMYTSSSTNFGQAYGSLVIQSRTDFAGYSTIFRGNGGETMRLSGGNLLVGGTSLNAASSVGFTAAGQIRQVFASGVANDSLFGAISGVSNGFQIAQDTSNNQSYIFHNGGSASLKIDAAGNVGIGGNAIGDAKLGISKSSGGDVFIVTDTSSADLIVNCTSGVTRVSPSTGTLALGTGNAEKLRIDSSGRFLVNTTSILSGSGAKLQVLQDVTGQWSQRINNSAAAPYGLAIDYVSASPAGTANQFHYCTDSGGARWGVYSNGGVLNYSGNNVNLSDRNAKKDITLHTDNEWHCVKAWEIVDYRYKDEADDSPAKIGVIAQQIQEHCPDLVNVFQEQADAVEEVIGEDGEVVTEAKAAVEERIGVNEAQMMWKVTKALQEAMERIETLEAKVQTLENK
jgi:hypothetical protein